MQRKAPNVMDVLPPKVLVANTVFPPEAFVGKIVSQVLVAEIVSPPKALVAKIELPKLPPEVSVELLRFWSKLEEIFNAIDKLALLVLNRNMSPKEIGVTKVEIIKYLTSHRKVYLPKQANSTLSRVSIFSPKDSQVTHDTKPEDLRSIQPKV